VDTLVRDGLAERAVRPGDRRSVVVCLTPRGLASARRINKAWDRICADMFKGIPAGKHGRIIEVMALISGALAGCTRGFKTPKQCRE
jgi:DNA-binding MarR family transcriptional regulator